MEMDRSSATRRPAAQVVLFAAFVLWAPATWAAPPDPAGGTGGTPLSGTLTVTVVAAGTTVPIAGAFVMAGPAEDQPFPGNVGFTDASGQVVFAHPALTGAITVTAGAAGRSYASIFSLGVSEVVLPLPPLATVPTARLGDQFTGIEVNDGFFCLGDGNLDFGIVLPAAPIEEALSGGAGISLSTTAEPLSTPQGPVPVPSNLQFPRQCEAFQYFEKSSYHLRVATGRRTLFGLSARASLTAFLNATTVVDLIRAMNFREMGILRDRNVAGDSDTFDLVANLALSPNLTVQVSNGQPGTAAYVAAGGRLTAPDGQHEVAITGVGAFDPDVHGTSATLTLTTRPASFPMADLIPAAFVTMQRDVSTIGNGSGSTTSLVRSGFTPPTTLTFASFFGIVEVASSDDRTFSWTDVSSATSPPARHLNTSRLVLEKAVPDPDTPGQTTTEPRTWWVLTSPGAAAGLTLPSLPPSAPTPLPDPTATADNDRFDFSHAVQYLGDAPGGFDYGGFAFKDAAAYGTHVSTNGRPLRCGTAYEVTRLNVAKGATPDEVVLTWDASPDLCHDTLSGRGYEVYAATSVRPAVSPGSWPVDPPFAQITGDDADGNLGNASFTHTPSAGFVAYIVVDRGLSGNLGPAGHY